MEMIKICAKNEYDYIIGPLSDLGEEASKVLTCKKICIVSDSNVGKLYLESAKASLEAAGFDVSCFVFPAGEASKNPENLIKLLETLSNEDFTKGDALAALGGGSVGDLTGLAAGLYHRGMAYIQLPTTLLAAIDSSIGGKTAVDLKDSKNAIGLIYQPKLVYYDLETIFTLPAEEIKSGLGEASKYSLILGKELGEVINEDFILSCVKAKAKLIEEDECDEGQRAILNLGHTAAHAIETCSEYKISHGMAVAMGLYIETKGSYAIGNRYADSLAAKVLETLDKFDLKKECPYTAAELFNAALKDKKRSGDTIRLPMLTNYGKYDIREISLEDLKKVFLEGLSK